MKINEKNERKNTPPNFYVTISWESTSIFALHCFQGICCMAGHASAFRKKPECCQSKAKAG